MKVFYDIGSFNFPLTCCFLGDDGRLWKVLLDPVGTPGLMASNVRDFDMRVEESTSIFIPPFYRVFAMQDTQAWAIHLNTLSSTVIYPVGPPPGGKTLGAIAADTNRVYLIEKFSVPCGPFSCVNYNVLRQELDREDLLHISFRAPTELPIQNRIVPTVRKSVSAVSAVRYEVKTQGIHDHWAQFTIEGRWRPTGIVLDRPEWPRNWS